MGGVASYISPVCRLSSIRVITRLGVGKLHCSDAIDNATIYTNACAYVHNASFFLEE